MKLVILDRDGVINEDSDDYIKSVAEWVPIPGSLEAIARLCQAGYRVFVASNQAGIGRGLFDYDALLAMHAHLQQAVKALGGQIDGIAFAPEHPDQATDMRKPNPGMLRDIARRLGVGLEGVPFVGDTVADLQAGRASGARPILVRTGKGLGTEKVRESRGVPIYDDLAAFVSDLLQGA
ncbi:MAG: family hydrolase [Panacagrimonas sp.]|jgi:D-glycero-D-manno-heptose 1,7-bisphosphate phosphatase|nr:D-glycero-beta-D-manno-heptose 1,7-bisphosphate 7-phosphatase [Panacagrimonas sp.]MCC2656266.1 family hydrolase [Panacagrimonas sp.]